MKICIWFNATNQPWGGGNQFLRALAGELESLGHEVSQTPGNSDVVLINSHNVGPNHLLYPGMVAQVRQTGIAATRWSRFIPASLWTVLPRRGPVIVHRLDGVPEVIRKVRGTADRVIPLINVLADFTIFQSVYSSESFAHYNVQPLHSRVIHNGVDGKVFYPLVNQRTALGILKIVGSSWSPNITKGFPVIAKLSRIPGVEVSFVGRWHESVDPLDVKLLGVKTSSDLAEVLRNSDAMIHAGENESCSNAILEALACGLPVLYLDSGGNRELVGGYGVATSGQLHEDVERLRANLSIFREKVHAAHADFLIGPVAERYVQAFESASQLRDAS